MTRVLVVGASGTVGRAVVEQLSANGCVIRALSRKTADSPASVETVFGDLTEPESLHRASLGMDAVFLVWTAPPETMREAVERLARNVSRIVYLSAPFQTPDPFFQASQPNAMSQQHAQLEAYVRAAGVHWTFLRPHMLAANSIHWWAPYFRSGQTIRWPYLAAATAPIDERDIAAVACQALQSSYGNDDYLITGPASLTQRGQLEQIGEVIGRLVHFDEITSDDARVELAHFPTSVLNMLLASWAAATRQPALVTTTVAEVTGVPARSFSEWVRSNRSAFVS